MRAVVRSEYGDTSVLRVDDVEEPALEPGRVIVDVVAAGVNMAEWHLMSGEPALIRLAMGFPRPKLPVLGADLAGVVTAIGAGVTRFAVGDEVFGLGRGSWATRVSAKEELLQPKPAAVTFEQAAAVPMAGHTALQAVRSMGSLMGRSIAVTGAGGGVGSYAVQLASAGGARVTAVCSASKADFVRELGADEVVDYTTTNPTEGSQRFDAVLDFAGSLPLASWRRVIREGGVLVLGGGEGGGKLIGALSRSIRAPFTRGIRVVTLMASSRGEDLAELRHGLDSGELRSTHSRTYAFSEAAEAIEALRAAEYPGKIVLTP